MPMKALTPIGLLLVSNVFMTFAWYGQLRVHNRPLWLIIVVSWGIAFFEYCLAVPANRIGAETYSPAQLKIIQEIITLSMFPIFSWAYLGDKLSLQQLFGFALVVAGAFFVFKVR